MCRKGMTWGRPLFQLGGEKSVGQAERDGFTCRVSDCHQLAKQGDRNYRSCNVPQPELYHIQKRKSNTYDGVNTRASAWDGKKSKPHSPSLPPRTSHSPELSPDVLRAPLFRRPHRPRHWTRRIRSRVAACRIKEHTISDERPSQFILIVIIFDINVQVRSAAPQVDRFRTRKYRLPGSVCRCSATRPHDERLPVNSLSHHRRQPDKLQHVPRNQ